MDPTLTAQDIWPLVCKLPPAERHRLLAMASALDASDVRTDAARYAVAPVAQGELSADESGLGWDAEGWDEFYAPTDRWPEVRRALLVACGFDEATTP